MRTLQSLFPHNTRTYSAYGQVSSTKYVSGNLLQSSKKHISHSHASLHLRSTATINYSNYIDYSVLCRMPDTPTFAATKIVNNVCRIQLQKLFQRLSAWLVDKGSRKCGGLKCPHMVLRLFFTFTTFRKKLQRISSFLKRRNIFHNFEI